MTAHTFSLLLTGWLLRDVCLCFVEVFIFFKYHIILELKANFTVRRHILLIYFFLLLTGVMRKEKGGKRGKKKMDERQEEREKESGEVEERSEERMEEGTEGGTQEIEEQLELTEEAYKEEERCEEDLESHSAARRARVCSTFTDSQETAIVEFVKEHPELYDKEHARFHDRQKKEALWAEISAELKLQPFDVRRWYESQRTRYGKLSKLQSGQAPREMTKTQSWVYQQMGFLIPISDKGGQQKFRVRGQSKYQQAG